MLPLRSHVWLWCWCGLVLALASASVASVDAAASDITVFQTAAGTTDRITRLPSIAWQPTDFPSHQVISVNQSATFQRFLGFGGAFTESAGTVARQSVAGGFARFWTGPALLCLQVQWGAPAALPRFGWWWWCLLACLRARVWVSVCAHTPLCSLCALDAERHDAAARAGPVLQ